MNTLPMIPTDLEREFGRARLLETLDLHDQMRRAQGLIPFTLSDVNRLALWARVGIFGTELEKRCAAEFGEENPIPGPWRDARSVQPDADETVLAVRASDAAYAIAVFEAADDGRGGAWLDAATFQPVFITHWMPLIGILEPPAFEE